MGADLDMFTVLGGNKLHVEKRFKAHIEDCEREYGTLKENNGRLKFTNLRFKDYNTAYEYISEHAIKWEDALVVEFRNGKGQLCWLIGGLCSC